MYSFVPPAVSAWVAAHAAAVALAVLIATTLDTITRLILRTFPGIAPYVMRNWPRVAHVAIALGHLVNGLAPFVRRVWMAFLGVPFPEALPDDPPPPSGGSGPGTSLRRVRSRLELLWLAFAVAVLAGCSASQVQVEATVADSTSRAYATIVEPDLIAAMHADERAAMLNACPDPHNCSLADEQAAIGIVQSHWLPVWDVAHGHGVAFEEYRVLLERCRHSDAGQCGADVVAAGARVASQSRLLRCALLRVGHADLYAGDSPPTCDARDGGVL